MRSTREEIVRKIQQEQNEKQIRYLKKLRKTEEACIRHRHELDAERTTKAIELAESRKLAMERIQANRAQVAAERQKMIIKVEEKISRKSDVTTGRQVSDEVRAEQMRARHNFSLQKQALAEEAKKIRLPLFQTPIQDTRASRLRAVHTRLVKRRELFENQEVDDEDVKAIENTKQAVEAGKDEDADSVSLDAPPKSGRWQTEKVGESVASSRDATTPKVVKPAMTPRAKAQLAKAQQEKREKMRLMRCSICEIESYHKDLIDLERSVVQTILTELGAQEHHINEAGDNRPGRVCQSCLDFAGNYLDNAADAGPE